jgi:predicted dienelactone hydrolase
MQIKHKKSLLFSVILCSYVQVITSVNAEPLFNDKAQKSAKLIPEELNSRLPADVVPELAEKGMYDVGVKTIEITNPAQFNPATQTSEDRQLTVEVWYPTNGNTKSKKTSYEDETRSGIKFSIQADAFRDAPVYKAENENKFPLVVISHGYTGYRTIMYYLAEHLASNGYVVAAIDHTDSTNAEVDMKNSPFSGFFSTLLNRSRDQQFTLNHFTSSQNFVSASIDKNKAGLIGYSMGGFGAVNTIGGCYNFTPATASTFTGLKDPEQVQKVMSLLNSCSGGQYQNVSVDKKWQAAVALAPWGGQHNLFKQEAMAKVTTPILYIGGSLDDVSGYDGIKSLYEKTGSKNKYLLTYQNARHNIAPHPAPAASKVSEIDIGHYHDSAWDSVVFNNTNKHFTLAMMDCHLKQQVDKCEYLDLSNNSNQIPVEGKTPEPWKGFDHRYSTGMNWQMVK